MQDGDRFGCLPGGVCRQGLARAHAVLVVGVDEQLLADTAAEALWSLANLEIFQEPIVDELGLN